MLDISPKLDDKSPNPLYMQIYEYIKNEILCGRIACGSKLPSIRNLSLYLNVSKNTVEGAYQQLISEGYVKSQYRSGLYVEELEGGVFNSNLNSSHSINRNNTPNKNYKIKYDFSNGQIDVESFPYSSLKKVLHQCMDSSFKELLLYGDHQGDLSFRVKITEYLHQSRGVMCSPEQIIISSGTQQSLSLLCLLISDHHSCIGFEEPGYIGARAIFQHFKFNIKPIPLGYDGISIDNLKRSKVNVVYVTPSHQFPYGMVMPVSNRLKLLQWAEENNSIIIEDDYDGEFRYKGKPIPSLQGLNSAGRVVYLGTFSKSLMPSIRISYLVLPQKLLDNYKKNYMIYEQPVSRLLQKSLEIFMDKGYWEKHIRKCRVLYKRKHEILIKSINELMGNKVKIIGADSGLHILLQVNTDLEEHELIKKAEEAGIKVSSTSTYWMNYPHNVPPVIFIGFAGIKIDAIYTGIKLLRDAWF